MIFFVYLRKLIIKNRNTVKQTLCIGILLFGFAFGTNFAVAQKIPYMMLIDSKEMKHIDNSEISIQSWREYEAYLVNRYGADSEEARLAFPDTAPFRKHYTYAYISATNCCRYAKRDVEFMKSNYQKRPMIGVSYEQALEYCKWRTAVYNLSCLKGVEKIEFSLPTKEDYKRAESYAEITHNPPLSALKNRKSGKPCGITDNVAEYTLGDRQKPDGRAVGFRCVARIVLKK